MSPSLVRQSWFASLFVLVLMTAPATAQTTTYTWTGGDIDDGWFSSGNWSAVGSAGPPPLSSLTNTFVVMSGTTRLSNTLDYSFSANSLTFNAGAGAFIVGTPAPPDGPQTLTLGTGGITIASGNTSNQTFNANLALGAAGTWANNGAGTFTVGGAVDNGGFLLTVGGAGNSTYNGAISGSGGLTKAGAGTLTLTGANTFTGLVTISGGVLQVPNVSSNTAGAADHLGVVPSAAIANAVTISNGGILRNTNTGTVGSSFVTPNRGITLGSGGGVFDLPDTASGTFLIYAGTIAQGANPLTKTGAAILALSGTTSGTGALNINQGMIRLRSSSNRISDTAPVTIAGGAALDMATFSDTIGSLAGAGSVTFSTGTGTLTTGGINTSTTFSGVISGAGSFTKTGAGTQTLTGINTFTGTTTINGGTLAVGTGGSLAAGSTATVNNSGTLAGTGTVNRAVTVNTGGTIRGGDGAGVGTLTLGGGLTLAASANLGVRLTNASAPSTTPGGSTLGTIPNPTSNNFLNITAGGLTANFATLQIVVDGTGTAFDPSLSYSYQVGAVAGQDLSAITVTSQSQFTPIGFADSFHFSLSGDGGGAVFLNMTPVPEPAAILGLAGGVLVLGQLARRRNRIGVLIR